MGGGGEGQTTIFCPSGQAGVMNKELWRSCGGNVDHNLNLEIDHFEHKGNVRAHVIWSNLNIDEISGCRIRVEDSKAPSLSHCHFD